MTETEESQAAFTVKFNLSGGSSNYKKFIETLRRRVGEYFFHNHPVLPNQNSTNQRFHIVLVNNDIEITLSIRWENLYLIGYKTKDSTSWLEIEKYTTDPASPHQILGSTFLGFSGNYRDLERAACKSRNEIALGQQSLIGAAYDLQNSIKRPPLVRGKIRAHALIIMIQMICEPMRFVKISDHIVENFSSCITRENWMVDLEVNWERISCDLLSRNIDDEQINPALEANTILGVRLFKFSDVLLATVKVILKKGGGNIHGCISAWVNIGKPTPQILFRKSIKDDREHVRLGESMRLSTSVIAIPLISSDPTLRVEAQLFHKNSGISKHEIANGIAEFSCQHSGTVKKTISGGNGEIQVEVTWKQGENIQQGS